jgi:transposase
MVEQGPVLGIDVSKLKVDVCLITAIGGKEKYRTFRNSETGFQELAKFLERHGIHQIRVCLEPTGRYGNKIALWLQQRGHQVSMVNPYRIKGFAISELKRSKTDKIDAGVIARFCQMHSPELWTPKSNDQRALQEIGRYHDRLKDAMTQEKNRMLAGVEDEDVRFAIEQHIAYMNGLCAQLQSRMREIIQGNKQLTEAFNVLRTICGVGQNTAFAFLGEIGLGEQFRSTRQVEAYCGMNPRLRQSGNSLNCKPRLSKMGNNRMRRALYMPALTALRVSPAMQSYAERLRSAGKHNMVIVGAIMRKLLRIMFAVVRSNNPYDLEAHMRLMPN